MMERYFLVGLGSALGGMARYWLTMAGNVWWGSFPWGTLVINILGSAVIGAVMGMTSLPPNLRLFLMTGICGGFTTFSAFSLQTLEMLERGSWPQAAAYGAASVGLCVAGCWLGYTAIKV